MPGSSPEANLFLLELIRPKPSSKSINSKNWKSVVAAHRNSHSKPPFSIRQLCCFAILDSKTGSLHLKGIGKWIEMHFWYYARLNSVFRDTGSSHELRRELQNELCLIDSPLTCEANVGYKIPLAIVDGIIGKNPPAFPQFLRLPGEIRIMIYRFALSYPTSNIPWKVTGHHLQGVYNGRFIPHADPKIMLSLLQANRQLFNEAVSFFYIENIFEFPHTLALWSFLRGIGPVRRKYVQEISVNYFVTIHSKNIDLKYACRAFTLLAECEGLRKLTIDIDDNYMNPRFTPEFSKWPGLMALSRIRGVRELVVTGHADEVRPWLATHILQPREQQPTIKKKRTTKKTTGPKGQTSDAQHMTKANRKSDTSVDLNAAAGDLAKTYG